MCRWRVLSILCTLCVSSGLWAETPQNHTSYWPQWRGPLANGVAPAGDPPIRWSETENVAWKVPIPGKGSATPIVWQDLIFVQTAIPLDGDAHTGATRPQAGQRPPSIQPDTVQQFAILALRRIDGSVIWQKVLRQEVPHEGTHATGTWASNSPVTDGEHVWAYFGSRGLYCLDLEGNLVWQRNLGEMRTRRAFGEGSSPALYGDTLVVNWDHEGDSFIVALDKSTGEEIWRRDRDEITSWSTPLVVSHDGRQQVIVNATGRVRAYDLASGHEIWEVSGMTVNVIPTPVHLDGLVVVTSGFRGNALLTIRLAGARGDITGSGAIVWSLDRDTPYTPSPVLYDEQLFFLKTNDGILSSHNVRTGEKYFGPVRLDNLANVYASPVGAAGRIYIVGREGGATVIEVGPKLKILAENQLNEGFDASPAIVNDELYLRGRRHLYRISH